MGSKVGKKFCKKKALFTGRPQLSLGMNLMPSPLISILLSAIKTVSS
jgi:hypothetical protein